MGQLKGEGFLALPPNKESARTRQLQDILDSTEAHIAFAEWPRLEEADYFMIGRLVYLFNFIEMNLRRMVEAWQEYGLLELKGRAQDLHIGDVEKTVQEMFPWPENELLGLKQLAYFRTVRNLVAHFAAKRFPNDDAFLFIAKSERDFKRQFPGVASVSNMMLTVIVDASEVRHALEDVESLQIWLGTVTGQLVKQAYDQRRDVPKAS
jgi:hypothetical protein